MFFLPDLNPRSIFFDESGAAKLNAFSFPSTVGLAFCSAVRYTATHAPQSGKRDVFSFGVLLWELFAQEVPFPGKGLFEIVSAISKGKRPPLDRPGIGSPIKALVSRCWDADPGVRPSFDQIVEDLDACIALFAL
jgi:hypothetical protein